MASRWRSQHCLTWKGTNRAQHSTAGSAAHRRVQVAEHALQVDSEQAHGDELPEAAGKGKEMAELVFAKETEAVVS